MSKALKILPQPGIVFLKVAEAKAGVLDVSSKKSAVEYAEVAAVGEGVTSLKVGDKVFVKAWAVDIITHEDQEYRFVSIDSKGILSVIK